MLPEDALVEDAPPPAFVERTPFRDEPVREEPARSEVRRAPAPREEEVLGDQDIVIEREEPEIVRARDEDVILREGEIERESSYEAERTGPVVANAGGKSIVVPIDLGSLPRSGKLRVTFEFTIDVVDAHSVPRQKPNAHMRDLDPVS